MQRLVFTILMALFSQPVFSQESSLFFFKSGDRICFIGNSITNSGQFYNFVTLYYATRFPSEKLQFFNCGIGGDVGAGVIKRLDRDILVHKPTWSILMLGMNDVGRGLYRSREIVPAIEEKKKKALDTYRENLEIIIRKLLANNSKIILEKPTIYDQTVSLSSPNDFANDGLKVCAGIIQELAVKYKLMTVDYFTIMGRINHELQLKDSAASILNKDRIHPNMTGHFVMAYEFLKTTGAKKYVSKIVMDAGQKKNNAICDNCTISDLTINRDSVTFKCRENSLPFPLTAGTEKALELVPFTDDFNWELLQINGLKRGEYDFYVDDIFTGKYTSNELDKGINMAVLNSTPQYKQAARVMELCAAYRNKELLLRTIKGFEHYQFPDSMKDESAAKQLAYADKKVKAFTDTAANNIYVQYKNYLINKPLEEGTLKLVSEIFESIYDANKPKEHVFKIIRTN